MTTGPLREILGQVASENRGTHSKRLIETRLDFKGLVYCDSNQIAELLSNLLGNALYIAPEIAHAHDAKIEVLSTAFETRFKLKISSAKSEIFRDSVIDLKRSLWI